MREGHFAARKATIQLAHVKSPPNSVAKCPVSSGFAWEIGWHFERIYLLTGVFIMMTASRPMSEDAIWRRADIMRKATSRNTEIDERTREGWSDARRVGEGMHTMSATMLASP